MCMFSRPVRQVASTRIFARHFESGEQALVYSMSVRLAEPTAMILPLPVPPDSDDHAVRFVDLSGYSAFFEHLHRAFPTPVARGRSAFALQSLEAPKPTLKVHRVGSFEASFVPSRADFTRLDDRFRLDDDVWAELPYDDWGFAVFQLAANKGIIDRLTGAVSRQTVHPMAFIFPRRNPRTLFFPTLHVHDGSVHAMAEFDHQLYCQPDPITAASFSWRKSEGDIGDWVDASKAQSLIAPDEPAFLLSLIGSSTNRDVTLTPPDVTLDTLRPRHALFALGLSAHPAYFAEEVGEPGATQRRIALDHLDEVGRRIGQRLAALVSSRRIEWCVDEYDEDAIEHTMSSTVSREGKTVIRLTAPGQPWPGGPGWKAPTGRGRIRFGLQHEQLGSIGVWLTFTQLPESETYLAIQREFEGLLDPVWRSLEVH